MIKKISLLCFVLLLSSLYATTFEDEYQQVTRLEKESAVPTYNFEALDGSQFTLDHHKKALVVSIFTTWCSVCKHELKQLNVDYHIINDSQLPIEIIAINGGESLSKVTKYKKQRKLDFPIVIDEHASFIKSLHVLGTPTILIFNTDNKLVYQGTELPKEWINLVLEK